MEISQRIERARRYVDGGGHGRKSLHGSGDMSLAVAILPEYERDQCASDCPPDVMPEWMVYLTDSLDFYTGDEAWAAWSKRYVDSFDKWTAFDVAQWDRVLRRILMSAALDRCIDIMSDDHSQAVDAVRRAHEWFVSGQPGGLLHESVVNIYRMAVACEASAAAFHYGEVECDDWNGVYLALEWAAEATRLAVAAIDEHDIDLPWEGDCWKGEKRVWDPLSVYAMDAIDHELDAHAASMLHRV